nr:hypothetical protein CFP56_05700 [Quercus suber]
MSHAYSRFWLNFDIAAASFSKFLELLHNFQATFSLLISLPSSNKAALSSLHSNPNFVFSLCGWIQEAYSAREAV